MFSQMPSWVPLDCIPQPVEELQRFEQVSKFTDGRSYSSQSDSFFQEGRLSTSEQSHTFRLHTHEKIMQPCKQVFQQSEVRSLMATYREGVSKTFPRLTLEIKQADAPSFSPLPQAGFKQVVGVVLRVLSQMPTVAKPLPRPIDASSLRAPTSFALPGQADATHSSQAARVQLDQKQTTRDEKRVEKKEEQSPDAKPLSKRTIEHFVFPLYIKIDEKEEGRRQGARDTAKAISKVKKKKVTWSASRQHTYHYQKPSKRPELEPPRLGIFALYYILSKLGILSDAASHWEAKEDIQKNQEELDKLHKLRLEEMQKAIKSEDKTKRWSISTQIFSWMGSFMAIITGVTMIMSGVGAIAGAMILTSGLFMLTNHILMITGGWDKICDKLPGDDKQKKKAVVTWMQIGITVLCLILSGAGGIFGGFGAVGEAMQHFQAVFGGIMMLAGGISSIGQGVTTYQHRNRMAEGLRYKRKMEQLKHKQEDLFEKAHAGVDRIHQLFKELSRALDFEAELFRADQMVNGR